LHNEMEGRVDLTTHGEKGGGRGGGFRQAVTTNLKTKEYKLRKRGKRCLQKGEGGV